MESHTIFAALRDALANLYPEEQNARVVVADAGLAAKNITFSTRAQTNWHNILTEAVRAARLEAVLQVARTAYSNNLAFTAAYIQYCQFIHEGGRIEALEQRPSALFTVEIWHAPFQAPSKPPYFVGRRIEIDHLSTYLQGSEGKPIIGLCGLGGVGKTTLAIHIAHLFKERFADGVLWAQLDSTQPDIALQNFGAAFGQAEQVARAPDLAAKAVLVRQILAEKRLLVVLDNAETADSLQYLIPSGTHNVTLITTRNRKLLTAVGATIIELIPFDEENSRALLIAVIGQARIIRDMTAAQQVIEWVGGLPLALSIVAGYLTESEALTLADYLELLRDEQTRLQSLTDWDDRSRNVAASFQLSYQRLPSSIQQVFAALSVFDGPDFGVEAVAVVTQRTLTQAKLELGRLHALSLVEVSAAERAYEPMASIDKTAHGRYRLHPLLKDFARHKLGDEADAVCQRAAFYLVKVAQQNAVDGYDILDVEWQNMAGMVRWAWQKKDWSIVLNGVHGLTHSHLGVVGFLDARGYWRQARDILTEGLQAARALADPQEQVHIRTKQAAFAFRQGEFPEAKRHLAEASGLLVALTLSAATAHLWTLFHEFAYRCTLTENPQRALAELQRGIEQLTTIEAETVQQNLGCLYILSASGLGRLGRMTEAVAAIERGLKLLPATPSIAQIGALQNLGSACFQGGDYKVAQQHYEAALGLAQALQSARHLAMLERNIGAVKKRTGHFQAAIDHYNHAAERARHMADIEGEGFIHSNLGNCYLCLGEDAQAFTHFQRALDIAEQHTNADLKGAVLVNLGHLHLLREEFDQAAMFLTEAKAICQQVQSPDLAEVLMLQAQLAVASTGNAGEALLLLDQAEQAQPDSLTHGVIERVKGDALSVLGRSDDAIQAYQRSLACFSDQDQYPLAQTKLALARHYLRYQVGDSSNVEPLLKLVLATFEVLGAKRDITMSRTLLEKCSNDSNRSLLAKE